MSKIERVKVSLFRAGGKWYCDEEWRIPERVPHPDHVLAMIGETVAPIGPWDMLHSPDFRRIEPGGAVLVESQEPWGYPFLLVQYVVTENER